MAQLIHDSFFGPLVRYLSNGKLLPHEETRNPALLRPFIADPYNNPSERSLPEAPASDASTSNHSDGELAEKGKDPLIVDWYGPDDPVNPLNWSNFTKCAITFELCFLTLAVYIGSSVYTAGVVSVKKDFNIAQVPATLPLTVFVLGFGLGPMTLAPLSEAPAVGRMPTYVWSLLAYVLLQIPVALSVNLSMLMVFRFVTGVLGSPPLATGGASIAEIFTPRKRSLAIAIWGVAANVTVKRVAYLTIIRPWILTFTEPLVFLLRTWTALIFGLLFIWFTSFPFVFQGLYRFNAGETGLSFRDLLVGALLCVPPFVLYDRGVQRKMFDVGGQISKPEQRLVPAMATAAYHNLGIPWASSLLGFLGLAYVPIPFLFYFYGERFRNESKRARHT
ncbi:hypothetical protein A1O7_03054 [Cladophialophora yegresii CBS 114405]|uniref:Major facilitator superfamily (MFS) profile domain-containing protein n=1 Tax=Cladophialophora yegresii CBS 114405 TaxID=1182544 RepID=W9WDH6_9EURO|nr:uncharacterized protein A1O7_03054 [Cladophialophora yegresii CBS 114405]EXJ62616.1 hypothetical protein A1O7_03054 [Cladophialophora yegresii CBS 114405]